MDNCETLDFYLTIRCDVERHAILQHSTINPNFAGSTHHPGTWKHEQIGQTQKCEPNKMLDQCPSCPK
ncbi:hypothetical protein X801_07992, partial [Opisthorchis viverrini]